MNIIRFVANLPLIIYNYFNLMNYRRVLPHKVSSLRNKDKIRVLFLLSDLSLWKSEELYLAMLAHPRFEPIIGTCLLLADVGSESTKKYLCLLEYLKQHNYIYHEIYHHNISSIKADITFYQQPYGDVIDPSISFMKQILNGSLVCYLNYAFYTVDCSKNNFGVDLPMHRYSWQVYFENTITLQMGNYSKLRGKNSVLTGLPIQDILSRKKELFKNPWIPQSKHKKRVIFAPDHTIPTSDNYIQYSQFLEVADIMLDIAREYNDTIQFAFKPHPFLKKKLYDHWGKERTDIYYNTWNQLDNCQIAEGDYIGLFKYSDAMVHDCSSFTIEYCYTLNPVLYLIRPDQEYAHLSNLNDFGKKAFELHSLGVTKSDIQSFLDNILAGNDNFHNKRLDFYNKYLLPPYGKTASENIIDAILG